MTKTLEWVEHDAESRRAYKAIPHLWDRFTGDLTGREKVVARCILDSLLAYPVSHWYEYDVPELALDLVERYGGYREEWEDAIKRVVDHADATMLPMATIHEDRRGHGRKALDLVHSGKIFTSGQRWRAVETGEMLVVSLMMGALSARILAEETK